VKTDFWARAKTESSPAAPSRFASRPDIRKTLDVTRHYGGWATGGSYRIRVFDVPGRAPVVVCSQIEHRPGWCISAVVESLAATVIGRYLPQRLEEDEPVVWLEHYPADEGRRRRGAARLDVSRVTFAHWRPTIGTLTGVERPQIGAPAWTPLSSEQLSELVGGEDVLEA
jgi:hypothetical protein